jgi:hypothetical protein
MKKNVSVVMFILSVLICFAGCASMSDVVRAKDEGTVQVYPVNGDQS